MTQQERWTAEHIPDQTGRVFVVTGASSGLGLATARALARRGGHVILAVRDEAKGRRAAAGLTAAQPDARLEVRRIDLADLDSVRAFAEKLHADHARLDVLVNNAGVMAPPRTLSPQGHEVQFAANHLGHFALTGLLLGLLTAGTDPRVVTVSSPNHRKAQLYFDDLTGERRYSPMGYYNQSKLANAVFGHELHRRLTEAGSPVRSLLAHPGYTATGLQTGGPVALVSLLFGRVLKPLAQSPAQGRCRSCTRRRNRAWRAASSSGRTAGASCAGRRPGWSCRPGRPTPRRGGGCGRCRRRRRAYGSQSPGPAEPRRSHRSAAPRDLDRVPCLQQRSPGELRVHERSAATQRRRLAGLPAPRG